MLPSHFDPDFGDLSGLSHPLPRGKAPAEESTCYPCGLEPDTHWRNMIPVVWEYIRTDNQGGQRAAFKQSAGPLSVAPGS